MRSASGPPDISSLQPLLTTQEVAKTLRCSTRTVSRLINAGRLKAVKTGRTYKFRRKDVDEFIKRSLTRGKGNDQSLKEISH